MVWAGMSMHTKTPSVPIRGNLNDRKYQDDILQPVLVPHVHAIRGMVMPPATLLGTLRQCWGLLTSEHSHGQRKAPI